MISNISNITTAQMIEILLAIPAFLPITVCPGYLVGWSIDLYGFRQRSFMERLLWSVPLSVAISTISSVLIGKFLSLSAVAMFLIVTAALWVYTLAKERILVRCSGKHWAWGFHPLGVKILIITIIWIAVVVVSLVDFQSHERLFMSLTFYDLGARVNWAQSILRTGIPPANPEYFYEQSANLRYYYFWLVDCAAVAEISRLPVRAVLAASCIWTGFSLTALNGLFLKHFLAVGPRLREQFLLSISLLTVSGLSICVYLWNMLYLHIAAPGDVWSAGQISDWLSFFLFYPHHLEAALCCFFAFLLAWMGDKGVRCGRVVIVTLIAAALASAFGLSVYVTFAFFLVTLAWALWQVIFERAWRPVLLLAAGGGSACILLLPYIWELTHTASKLYSGSVFIWSVRETIPPARLLAFPLFQRFTSAHPIGSRSLANLILMPSGYALELGFYFAVLFVFLVPALRGRTLLTAAQRSLLFIAIATIPVMSVIRSGVISVNDFGIHSALLLQYPLLLLASELLMSWRYQKRKLTAEAQSRGLPRRTPAWLRSVGTVAIIFGGITTLYRALTLRFILPLSEVNVSAVHDPEVASLSHKAYISYIGYAKLDAAISRDAIVQFNPAKSWIFWKNLDLANINHQAAIASSVLWCGSELGGDPRGCAGMIDAIDPLFKGGTAENARVTCRRFRIQYLVANIYDIAWNDRSSWVWTLKPVVSDEEFRALDCQQ